MRLYNELYQRKKTGEKLDMKNMTYEMLYELWWKEGCTDPAIADLYEVRKNKVTNLRNKWGIKAPDTIVKEFEQRFADEIPPFKEGCPSKVVSPEAAALLRKIDALNDLELESLRLELARRYTLFSEVKQEVDFLKTVDNVIRQFWGN